MAECEARACFPAATAAWASVMSGEVTSATVNVAASASAPVVSHAVVTVGSLPMERTQATSPMVRIGVST